MLFLRQHLDKKPSDERHEKTTRKSKLPNLSWDISDIVWPKNLELTWTDSIGYVGKGDFETAGWNKPWIVFCLKTPQTLKPPLRIWTKAQKPQGCSPYHPWFQGKLPLNFRDCGYPSASRIPYIWYRSDGPRESVPFFFGDVKVELQDLVITIRCNQIIHHHFKIFFLQSIHQTFEYNNHNHNNKQQQEQQQQQQQQQEQQQITNNK